ncbi:hypothetical protein EB835_02230 [Brevibacterium sp. S22]|nr:hypothetical protein EB835_02230 [Brevibacterium sp. S22]
MDRVLCRVNRKVSVVLSDDGTRIHLVNKGEIQSAWVLANFDQIQVIAPKSFWNSGYLRFVSSVSADPSGAKYSPHSDPDAVVIVDRRDLQAGAIVMHDLRTELGVPVIGNGISDEHGASPNAAGGINISVRDKKGHEVIRLTETIIALDDVRVEMSIDKVEEIRVKNATFGSKFVQLVPTGSIDAWPQSAPDPEFPLAVNTERVFGTESFGAFLQAIELRHPERLVRLHKRDEQDRALARFHRELHRTTGDPVPIPPGAMIFGVGVYEHEIWLGDAHRDASIGGSILGVSAEYSVSGNIITTTTTATSMAGNTHIQRPQDERVFQLNVTGPEVSFTSTASAGDGATDALVSGLVNVINMASHAAGRAGAQTQSSAIPPKPQRDPKAADQSLVESDNGNSEALRRLLKLYTSGLITEEEFAQARADLR